MSVLYALRTYARYLCQQCINDGHALDRNTMYNILYFGGSVYLSRNLMSNCCQILVILRGLYWLTILTALLLYTLIFPGFCSGFATCHVAIIGGATPICKCYTRGMSIRSIFGAGPAIMCMAATDRTAQWNSISCPVNGKNTAPSARLALTSEGKQHAYFDVERPLLEIYIYIYVLFGTSWCKSWNQLILAKFRTP